MLMFYEFVIFMLMMAAREHRVWKQMLMFGGGWVDMQEKGVDYDLIMCKILDIGMNKV